MYNSWYRPNDTVNDPNQALVEKQYVYQPSPSELKLATGMLIAGVILLGLALLGFLVLV